MSMRVLALLGLLRACLPTPSGLVLDGDIHKPMPFIGFGTCCRRTARGAPLIASTKEFLLQGGRLIDTAQKYGNHADLAVAIRESGVSRAHIWLTSKIDTHNKVSTRAAALDAVSQTAMELGVEYIDLMLIHGLWTLSDAEAIEVWRGLIDAKAAGKVRHIGVSNFERPQIERLVSETGVWPAVLQLEYHPYVAPEVHELVAWCQQHGIAITAYGSLGGDSNRAAGEEMAAVAAEHGVTSAALLLRWALNRGVAVIPGATSAEHIRENLNIPHVSLNNKELQRIGSTAARPQGFRFWGNLPSQVASRNHSKSKGK